MSSKTPCKKTPMSPYIGFLWLVSSLFSDVPFTIRGISFATNDSNRHSALGFSVLFVNTCHFGKNKTSMSKTRSHRFRRMDDCCVFCRRLACIFCFNLRLSVYSKLCNTPINIHKKTSKRACVRFFSCSKRLGIRRV